MAYLKKGKKMTVKTGKKNAKNKLSASSNTAMKMVKKTKKVARKADACMKLATSMAYVAHGTDSSGELSVSGIGRFHPEWVMIRPSIAKLVDCLDKMVRVSIADAKIKDQWKAQVAQVKDFVSVK